ncbi:MAG: hypothetical protein M1541_00690 [Acidobacteria bacterium]|nr:hypothetical protein [Acidobacteriota bacterium]
MAESHELADLVNRAFELEWMLSKGIRLGTDEIAADEYVAFKLIELERSRYKPKRYVGYEPS